MNLDRYAEQFCSFFRHATGRRPYPYQVEFSLSRRLPELLVVPTGAGKTLTVLMGWLWRRRYHPDPEIRMSTPRRLVLMEPMRSLVEQTEDVVTNALHRVGTLEGKEDLEKHSHPVQAHVIMGGLQADTYLLAPEADAILIGTQDMLLSAALNRGYGLSRFRWPMAFGLLNNDCLWVADEIQLMGSGLATSVQLQAFREKFGTWLPSHTVWMSATARPDWLETVDFNAPDRSKIMTVSAADLTYPDLHKRLHAPKTLQTVKVGQKGTSRRYPRAAAQLVLERHNSGKPTLVVLNTVDRAQQIYTELCKAIKAKKTAKPRIVLLHGRFRPIDRRLHYEEMVRICETNEDAIVVSTQVVEAGVDVTFATLITELTPWASLVQRFGRLNRYGEQDYSVAYVIDVDPNSSAPYSKEELNHSRDVVRSLEGKSISPADLPEAYPPLVNSEVMRRKDIVELFDTTPDLSGNDIDISRFVRSGRDYSVHVFWRDWDREEYDFPPSDLQQATREELCQVPIDNLRKFLNDGRTAYIWDHLEKRWRPLFSNSIVPGMTVLLHKAAGGYSPELGWNPASSKPVLSAPTPELSDPFEAISDDPQTYLPFGWVTLQEHSKHVVQEVRRMLDYFKAHIPQEICSALLIAALWHDVGKAGIFQRMLLNSAVDAGERSQRTQIIWAKAPRNGQSRHVRPYYRHELASALTFLQNLGGTITNADLLTAYLVAAHHGRVRLTIRSMPGELWPQPIDESAATVPRFALGVWDGDRIPKSGQPVWLSEDVCVQPTRLDLSCMEVGADLSWTASVLTLRDSAKLGVFRLSFLEALLRSADARASRDEGLIETDKERGQLNARWGSQHSSQPQESRVDGL